MKQSQRLSGTCDWILSNLKYSDWCEGNTQPPIIWLYAPPGSGKSTLCARIICSIQESDPKAAVAFHFYQFDKAYSAIETLRLLADQLFEKHWNGSHSVPDEIHVKTQSSSSSLDNIRDFITILVKTLPKTYFILDGLDEECLGIRWTEAQAVLDFLVKLSSEYSGSVRLWCSSQNRSCIQDRLRQFTIFDIKGDIANDVTDYLSRRINELDGLEVPHNEQRTMLEKLKNRADGNFLWASLMMEALMEEASSIAEMRQFIEEGLPSSFDGYYQRIFRRIEAPHRSVARSVLNIFLVNF